MKKFMTFLMLLLCSMQSASAMNVDAFMDKHIAPVSDAVANLIFFPISVFGWDEAVGDCKGNEYGKKWDI